jgi:hypothetical protein
MKPSTTANVGILLTESSSPFNMDEIAVKHSFQRLLRTISNLSLQPSQSADSLLSCVADRGPARVASLVAEPFGVKDWGLIEEATFASLCLDVFSHAVDDIADDPDSDNILLAHVGSLLLAKAAQVYAQLVAGDKRFWGCWERYLEQASEAERCLRQHRVDRLSSFEPTSFVMLGQKSALINMSAALYASLTEGWDLLEPLEQGLMAVATGIQLIDDLIDWEQDAMSGTYTYPLVLATQRWNEGRLLQDSISFDSVFVEILDLARMKMEEGKVYCKGVGAYRMVSFVDSLIGRLEDAKKLGECSPEQLRWIMGPRLGH